MASVAATKPVSSIAMALASATSSPFVDIPKPRDAFAGGHHRHGMLPTPPNSISPTLPPRKAQPSDALSSPRSHPPAATIDSDIDLADATATEADKPHALSTAALANLDVAGAGAITPALLATTHLPDILLAHGPMAIRHVLSYLTQSVPGFGRIPPAKARRLVVAALESRGGGGVNGDIEFEKVGWGRWDARVRGQAARDARQGGQGALGSLHEGVETSMSPPASVPDSYAASSHGGGGLLIPRLPGAATTGRPGARRREMYSAGSWASSRGNLEFDEDVEEEGLRGRDRDVPEHEADKMSLDGCDDDYGSSSAPEEHYEVQPGRLDDPADATDEEDWAAIGAAALRAGVVPGTGGLRARCSKGWVRSRSTLARSAPNRTAMGVGVAYRPRYQQRSVSAASGGGGMGFTSLAYSSGLGSGSYGVSMGGGVGLQDSQEREAVEALMRMGSM